MLETEITLESFKTSCVLLVLTFATRCNPPLSTLLDWSFRREEGNNFWWWIIAQVEWRIIDNVADPAHCVRAWPAAVRDKDPEPQWKTQQPRLFLWLLAAHASAWGASGRMNRATQAAQPVWGWKIGDLAAARISCSVTSEAKRFYFHVFFCRRSQGKSQKPNFTNGLPRCHSPCDRNSI